MRACGRNWRSGNGDARTGHRQRQEHVLGADGQFHVEDEAVDLSVYGFEDWVTFGFFWMLAATVFYQFFTRYALNDSAWWTEEIARYLLVCVVFIGAAMSCARTTISRSTIFYRLMPEAMRARACRHSSTSCACCFSATRFG